MSADASAQTAVARLVERLIAREVPQLDARADERLQRLLHYSMRILGSRIAGSSLTTVAQSLELARRRLTQSGRAGEGCAGPAQAL